ncbi:MAG: hypothetical protein R3Y60_04370 [bacterium]
MNQIKRQAYKNIIISVIFRIICLIVAIPSIRILISTLGSEANGINSLFISIVGVLSISELGIGTAITFCMYKPIIDNDIKQVSALYLLFKKIYRIIGLIYLVIGLLLSPFIHSIANVEGEYNLQFLFILYLVPSALSYLYQHKIALLNAHKNNYISVIITQSCLLLKFTTQILVLYIFNSFELFYISYLFSEVVCLIITTLIVNKKYIHIIEQKNTVDNDTKGEIVKRIKALFLHKIGGIFVNTTDSIIISVFISVIILGKYSNYVLIMTSITSILVLLLTPLTSIIGHQYVKSKEETYKLFNVLYYVNFVISFIILFGYFAIADELIILLFGVTEQLARSISIVIAITHFITMMRKPVLLLRDSTGLYTKDKYKPLLECSINLVLSLILVQYFGVIGVLISTIFTSLIICHIVEPYMLYKYGFLLSPKKYFIRNYLFIATFIINVVIFYFVKIELSNIYLTLLLNGILSVFMSSVTMLIILLIDKDMKRSFYSFINK